MAKRTRRSARPQRRPRRTFLVLPSAPQVPPQELASLVRGQVLEVTQVSIGLVTTLAAKLPRLGPAPRQAPARRKQDEDDCCEGQPIRPTCRFVNIRLTPNFANLLVTVEGRHVCGIQSIAAFLASVTYIPVPPAPGAPPGAPRVIERRLRPITVGGQVLGAFEQFPCPSNIQRRQAQLTIPTRGVIGTVFAVVSATKSCCNVADVHGMDDPCMLTSSDRLII